ncbi:protein ACCELERATED CELL DEATH 6-like [Tripterygium wilfordii]|uniref:protein ACCELERATED CELL DEATH 6-like n=1 Tax=Tripterygium wilfordii TaxID=458696 RepID=UPI0018F7FE75|nr:protein ACCELERATED CELL DEATH 6-like [Tripterygium wilfordii]
MAKSDSEIDLERGTTSPGRSNSSTTDNLKTTRSLPSMGTTSSVSSGEHMNIELQKAATEDVDKFKKLLDELSQKREQTMPSIFETVSPFHNTLLHIASFHGSKNIVELIALWSPPTLKKTNLRGETALHTAAKEGKSDIVLSLIKLQKESASSDDDEDQNLFKMSNVDGNTALQEALINGHHGKWEGKFPLYLAAEGGYSECVKAMIESEAYKTHTWPCQNSNTNDEATKQDGVLQLKLPIHAAVVHAANKNNSDLLKYMLNKDSKFIDLRDEYGRSALHIAAARGYVEGVKCFLRRDPQAAFQRDNDGFFPVHFAAARDHVDVIKELRPHRLHLAEMLSHNYQNILHSATKNACSNVVSYVLKTEELEKQINQKDKDGNTPLHLTAIFCDALCTGQHSMLANISTSDFSFRYRRIKLYYRYYQTPFLLEVHALITVVQQIFVTLLSYSLGMLQRSTVMVLKKSGVKPSPTGKPIDKEANSTNKDEDKFKDISNAPLVAATLVATVTFAAGFTVPGGYNDSSDEQGIATMLRQATFHAFLVCDTVAMFSSIIAAVIFTWAQLGGEHLVSFAYQLALPSLALALNMMSFAYIFGIYVVVSKLNWLAKLFLGMGLCFQSIIAQSFLLLCFLFIADWSLIVLLKICNWVASIIICIHRLWSMMLMFVEVVNVLCFELRLCSCKIDDI